MNVASFLLAPLQHDIVVRAPSNVTTDAFIATASGAQSFASATFGTSAPPRDRTTYYLTIYCVISLAYMVRIFHLHPLLKPSG